MGIFFILQPGCFKQPLWFYLWLMLHNKEKFYFVLSCIATIELRLRRTLVHHSFFQQPEL
jgi:hypothetical protein